MGLMVAVLDNGKVVVSKSKEKKSSVQCNNQPKTEQGMAKVARGRQAVVEAKRKSSGV